MKENDADYVVLVIKKPSCCWECRFEHFGLCMATKERYSIKYLNAIPALCPLKPMPQKKEVEVNEIEDIMHTEYSIEDIYTNKYIVDIRLATDKLISLGWNYCLEELEK